MISLVYASLCGISLEKAFDRVPYSAIWCSPTKLGVDEWFIRAVQVMFRGKVSKLKFSSMYGIEFSILVGFH